MIFVDFVSPTHCSHVRMPRAMFHTQKAIACVNFNPHSKYIKMKFLAFLSLYLTHFSMIFFFAVCLFLYNLANAIDNKCWGAGGKAQSKQCSNVSARTFSYFRCDGEKLNSKLPLFAASFKMCLHSNWKLIWKSLRQKFPAKSKWMLNVWAKFL